MVLGPSWRETARVHPAAEGKRLSSIVRGAAEDLVARLRRAETLTGGFRDDARLLADALVDAALSECTARLAETGVWGQANQLPSSELWQIAGPLLDVGVLEHCARFKPHGYAGDYEMLTRICEGFLCDDPLGRSLDRYFQNQAAPQAVRSRTDQTAAAIVAHCLQRDAGLYRIVSVGSGPAIDLRRAVAMLPADRRRDVQIALLDLDPDALDFARQGFVDVSNRSERNETGGNGKKHPLLPREAIRCHRANLFRLPKWSGSSDALGRPDVLVASGLFDYLDDGPATAMIAFFWRQLAPGGLLLVGNFAPHNPTRAYMEWIGNWYLTYRTPDQLERLGREAGIPPDCLKIGAERLGVDLFLIGRK